MIIENPSKRIMGYIDLAIKVAEQSDHPLQSHGSCLVKAGHVINTGFNRNVYSSFANRFKDIHNNFGYVHAEIAALLNVEKRNTEGATLFVVRVNSGQLRMSKPCRMCSMCMTFCGIKKVFYSNNDGQIEMIRL